MALIPRHLRPSVIIRRKAMYSGVLGSSGFWKTVAIWVFGKVLIKRFFGKHTEVLDLKSLGPGRIMSIETIKPVSKRERKKYAKSGNRLPTKKEYTVLAQALADSRVKK